MLLGNGDLVKMRKAHPCGNDLWRITYVGADIKIKCEKCGRIVMLDRADFLRRRKRLITQGSAPCEQKE